MQTKSGKINLGLVVLMAAAEGVAQGALDHHWGYVIDIIITRRHLRARGLLNDKNQITPKGLEMLGYTLNEWDHHWNHEMNTPLAA